MKLEEIQLLAKFPQDKLKEIQDCAKTKCFDKGEVILPNNTSINHIYFVLTGRVIETAYTQNGKEIVFNSMTEGECFGLLSLINKIHTRTNYVAKTKCKICAIETSDFSKFMVSNSTITQAVLSEFSDNILRLFDRLYDMRALDVSQRTCVELMRYAEPLLRTETKSCMAIINNLPTHEEIANTIFSHREAVTKEFGNLKKTGVLRGGGKCRYIVDLEKLKARIEPGSPTKLMAL